MKKILLVLLLLAPSLHAQSSKINCRLLNFQRDAGAAQALFVVDEAGTATECKLPSSALSKPVALPLVQQTLVFRKAASEPPVASAAVPAGIREALVLFFPSGDAKLPYKTVVLDGSEKNFPPDGSLVLNLYSGDIRFTLGEHQIQLPSGKTASLARPAQRDDFNMAGVVCQFETKTGWRAAYESKGKFPDGQRHLYVTYVEPNDQRPRVRVYLD